jgi:hypothetical protein
LRQGGAEDEGAQRNQLESLSDLEDLEQLLVLSDQAMTQAAKLTKPAKEIKR